MEPQRVLEPPPPPPPPVENDEQRPKVGLFSLLDGLPAHVLVILGLTLALLVPMILGIKAANLKGARAEVEQGLSLVELDVQQYKDDKARKAKDNKDQIDRAQSKKSSADSKKRVADQRLESAESSLERLKNRASAVPSPDLPPGIVMTPPSPEEIRSAEAEVSNAQRAVDEAKKEVDQTTKDLEQVTDPRTEDEVRLQARDEHKLIDRYKAYSEAEVSSEGTISHLIIGWFGRLLLIVGLLVLTVQSAGLRQKILLIVLLVVLFSSLLGVNLNFAAQGNLGDSPRPAERVSPPPQQTPPPPAPNPNR